MLFSIVSASQTHTIKKIGVCLIFASAIYGMISCGTSGEVKTIPPAALNYEIAKGYFVKNTFSVQQPTPLLIPNQQVMDSILGAAATMGANGRPTPFDFSHEYGIVFIYPETDSSMMIRPVSLLLQSDTVRLSATIEAGSKQTYRMVPFILLKVSGTAPKQIIGELVQ